MKTYEKVFKSNPDLLPEIEEYILELINTRIEDKETLNNIELAVAEAAANSVIHGNKCDINKNVTVKIIIDDSDITLSFKDEGKGFSPDKVPDPTLPENILKGSGRGLHIMRSLVSDLNYIFSDNGTELIIKFAI